MGIKNTLLDFMKEEAYRPMDIQELVAVFDINEKEYKAFKKTLKTMEKEGLIIKTKKDRYAVPERLGLITGKLQAHSKGFGFLIPDAEGEKDVFIPSSAINGAMNGDKILVQITREDKNGKKREGEVVQILERGNKKFVGVYEDSRNFGFVVAEDTKINQDIFVSKRDRNGANDGDMVVVEITKWPEKRRSPEGRIVEVLGKKGEKGLDILTIIKKFGLPEEFPQKVLDFAEGIEEEIPQKEYERRKDLRDIKMVTIDGEDAKDLDDAVSIEKLSNGRYKLGVHIADVTHYVREKNPLDKEELLQTLGLKEHRYKQPNQLSGGQQQRTSIGRAIIKNPDLLLCDEPTGALDYHTSKDILQLIEDVNKKYGNTTIIVTHNDAIKDMADRVIYLHDGRIRENIKNTHKIPAKDLNW